MLNVLLMSVILGAMCPQDVVKTRTGGDVTIGFLGHSSIVLTVEDKVIYIDPVSMFADYSTAPKADVILITHHHDDHLDAKLIAKLSKEGTSIIGNAESVKALGKGIVICNNESMAVGNYLSVAALAAYNTTEGRGDFHPANGRDNGYVLTIGGSRIYIAGDSEPTVEMLELKDIDVAFLPVNQPYTMTVDQAVETVKVLSPKIFYPYHTGQTDFKTDLDDLVKKLADSGVEVRIRPME